MMLSARCVLDRLIDFRNLLDTQRHHVPRAKASAACTKLDHSIAVLTARLDCYAMGLMKAQHDTDRRWELRGDIRDAMRPVITIGRTILNDIPELATLRLPHEHASAGALVGLLYHLADTVTRHRMAFESEGLASGTADRLRSLAHRLNLAVRQRESSRVGNRRTRCEIAIAMRRGREAARVIIALIAAEQSERALTLVR